MFKNTYIMQSLNLWNFVIIVVYNADNSTGECQITYSRGTRNSNFLLPLITTRKTFWNIIWTIEYWDKVFKSGLSKFFKGCLPQNLLGLLLNTLYPIRYWRYHWQSDLTARRDDFTSHTGSNEFPLFFCATQWVKDNSVAARLILSQMFHFYTSWKPQKTSGFLTFSGGIEMYINGSNNENNKILESIIQKK